MKKQKSDRVLYCSVCGSRMNVYERRYPNVHYDVNTGKRNEWPPTIYYYWRCPHAGFFNFHNHDVGNDEDYQGVP